jgi:hypothetical protein
MLLTRVHWVHYMFPVSAARVFPLGKELPWPAYYINLV